MKKYKYLQELRDVPFTRDLSQENEKRIIEVIRTFYSHWKSLEGSEIEFDKDNLSFSLYSSGIARLYELDGYVVVRFKIGNVLKSEQEIYDYEPYEGFTKDDMIAEIKEFKDFRKAKGFKW